MRLKQFLNAAIVCSILATVAPTTAHAGSGGGVYATVETTSPQKVVEGMASKTVRGIANVATGWVELPKQIILTANEDGIANAVSAGLLKGVGMTVVRTVSGAGELATFFFPFPGFYDPFFEPAYVWQKE